MTFPGMLITKLKMNTQRNRLQLPDNKKHLLLHSCCAPCSGEVIEALLFSNIKFAIYFYNPNIHPRKEYDIRKNENIRFAEKYNIPFIDADYDRDQWFKNAQGMENDPERGRRCSMCFDMRFDRTAEYAFKNDFDIISSSLGISRWKNMDQINQSGILSVKKYPGISYWTYNWRKFGGSQRMIEISKQEKFYQQEYCGCAYSLRDTNKWRKQNNRKRIKIGEKFYEQSS